MVKVNLFIGAAISLFLCGCMEDSFGPLEFEPDDSPLLRVYVRNSTKATISVSDLDSLLVGERDLVRMHSPTGDVLKRGPNFDIKRGSQSLARVSYTVLRLPPNKWGNEECTINIAEPTAGTFQASTTDTTWIKIVSVQVL